MVLVCASVEMHITSYLPLIYCYLLCFFTQDTLSIPANVFRDLLNLTTTPLSLYSLDSSLDLILPPNATARLQDHGLRYRVPNTYVVLRSLFSKDKVQVQRQSLGAKLLLSYLTSSLGVDSYLEKANTDLGVTISGVTMLFYLGFPVDRLAMHDTIDAARK